MNNAGTMDSHHRHDSTISFASGTNIVLAVWLFVSPWVVGYASQAVLWDNLIVAAVVFVLAITRVRMQSQASAPSWINAVLGVWLIISPFAFRGVTFGQKWNCIIVGAVVALLALTSGAAGATRTEAK